MFGLVAGALPSSSTGRVSAGRGSAGRSSTGPGRGSGTVGLTMTADVCRRGRGSGTGPAMGMASIFATGGSGTEPVVAGSASALGLVAVVMRPPDNTLDKAGGVCASNIRSGVEVGSASVDAAGASVWLGSLGILIVGGKSNALVNQVTPVRKASTNEITIVGESDRRKALRFSSGLLSSISVPMQTE